MIYQLIFYVTDRCNCHCRNCFFRNRLNQGAEWSLRDIRNTFSLAPEINSILLTGGEPFLRPDLLDILNCISRHHPDAALNINTNGTFPRKIEKVLYQFMSTHRQPVGISVSLDGDAAMHNDLRGNSVYDLTMDTLSRLSQLKRRLPMLYLAVNSLLTTETIQGMLRLISMVGDTLNPDFHNIEIVRGNPECNKRIPAKDLRAFYSNYLKTIQARYPSAYEINRARLELQYRNYIHELPWGYPCHAGTGSVVLYSDGGVASCEMRTPVINLHDFSNDLVLALNSGLMHEEVKKIQQLGCACTHGCWLMTSMLEYLDRKYGARYFECIPEDTALRVLV